VESRQTTKTRPQQFKVADLVMRKAHPYHLEDKSLNRNYPFRIVEVLRDGAYRLETFEGELFLERGTWQTSSFTYVKMLCFNASFLNNLMFKVMLFFP